MKVLIIGAGNMGLTYGESFVNASVVSAESLFFLERQGTRRAMVAEITQHPAETEPGDFLQQMDLIVLAVKPQDFAELAAQIRSRLHQGQLMLSIMAGVRVADIQKALGVEKVVRAMPNLPAQVGQGMTVFTTSTQVSQLEVFTVQNLLNTTGKTLYTPEESLLDAATAVSGSGPAFVYFFMNAMMQAGRQMGFSEAEAQLLVRQTFLGAINLLNRNALHCQEWIERVSSRGGTTEAAMAFFAEKSVDQLIGQGLEVARQRAIELSKAW